MVVDLSENRPKAGNISITEFEKRAFEDEKRKFQLNIQSVALMMHNFLMADENPIFLQVSGLVMSRFDEYEPWGQRPKLIPKTITAHHP